MSNDIVVLPVEKSPDPYEGLDDHDIEWLKNAASEIHVMHTVTLAIITKMGQVFLKAKELYPRKYYAWCATEFPSISQSTIDNYVNVAKNMPLLPAEAQNLISPTALYKLAKPSVSDDVRDDAISILEGGHSIDVMTATIMAKAPDDIQDEYRAGKLEKKEAYELTKFFNARSPDMAVIQFVKNQKIRNVGVLNQVRQFKREHDRSVGDSETVW